MKDYGYYLFDWDGCLAKTLEVWLHAYKTVLAENGVHPADRELAHHFGDYSLFKHFGVEDYTEANHRTADLARTMLQTVDLYDGAKELLETLKNQNKKVAIVSSGSRDIVMRGMEHNGIAHLFDAFISGDDVTDHKPHPEALEKALAIIKGEAAQAVMIGDSRKDMEAAQNAGTDSVLMYPDAHRVFYDIATLQSYRPTYQFKTFSELTSVLHPRV